MQAACKEAWATLLARFVVHCPAFRAAARALATLDCLQALAATAQNPDFSRPQFIDDEESARVEIDAGRAPLLDAVLAGGAVPNDVALGGDGLRTMVISGPNMGGKSSYMCQVSSQSMYLYNDWPAYVCVYLPRTPAMLRCFLPAPVCCMQLLVQSQASLRWSLREGDEDLHPVSFGMPQHC